MRNERGDGALDDAQVGFAKINISYHNVCIFYDFSHCRFALEVIKKNGCTVDVEEKDLSPPVGVIGGGLDNYERRAGVEMLAGIRERMVVISGMHHIHRI